LIVNTASPFINMLFPPLIIAELVGAGGPDANRILIYVAVIVAGNGLSGLLSSVLGPMRSLRVDYFLKKLMAMTNEKNMTMDYECVEDPEIKDMAEKANGAMRWWNGGIDGLMTCLMNIISGALQLAGIITVLAILSPAAVAVLLLIVAIQFLMGAKYKKFETAVNKEGSTIYRRWWYYWQLNMNFEYGKDIRLYDAATLLKNRIGCYFQQVLTLDYRFQRGNKIFQVCIGFLNTAAQLFYYFYFGWLTFANRINIGEYLILLNAANQFRNSMGSIADSLTDLWARAEYIREFMNFMELPPRKPRGNLPVPEGELTFTFENVSFHYPRQTDIILHNVNLTIPHGQKLSVVGPNGAGKSTFIKLLARLYDPTEGRILLNGVDIRDYDYDGYLRCVGAVFQDFSLFCFTLRENISQSGSHENDARIWTALEKAGIEQWAREQPHGLNQWIFKAVSDDGIEPSGGEQQKIAIARAVYKNAPLVILDEPTAALDPMAEFEIYNHFNTLVGGKTAIYISHRLSSCRFCDVIAVFDGGRLIQYGSHDDLVAQPGKYADMFSAQAQYYQ
jgi:ABC-type multidrug transport system fused ATPase/permease subunit